MIGGFWIGQCVATVTDLCRAVYSVTVSNSENMLACVGGFQAVHVFDLESKKAEVRPKDD
jgi:hypothetical protein